MKLRNVIILLICICAGFLAQEALCSESHPSNIPDIQEATCSATKFTSKANSSAITQPTTITTPNLRTNGFRRTTSHTNIDGRTSHIAKVLSRRYFTRTRVLPVIFQTSCKHSADYLISIGILVI